MGVDVLLSPEQRLLLALMRPRPERETRLDEIRRMLAQSELRTLGDLLREQGVLASHGTRLLDACGEQLGPDLTQRIREATSLNARRSIVMEKVQHDAVGLLRDRGIPAISFKGIALAKAAYGDPAMRASVDLDLLVAPRDLHVAAAALGRLGFVARGDRLRRDGMPELHLTLMAQRAWAPRLDLHWRVHWADTQHGSWILDRATSTTHGALMPQPADELAILLLCYTRDGLLGVRLPTDIGAWWDRQSSLLTDLALEPLARSHPALVPALAAALVSAADLTGLPHERLLSPESLARAPRQALRMSDPFAGGDLQQLRAQLAIVEWYTIPRAERRGLMRRRVAYAAQMQGLGRASHVPKLMARAAWAAARGPHR